MIQNIPAELRQLAQWISAGSDKQPLNPRTGQPASVVNPHDWATFEEAVNTGFQHVGFVLADSDPYTIIDLDDPATIKVNGVVMPNPDAEKVARIAARHGKILEAFESYAEISQSGTGVHIIVRGAIPHGVRRDKVEMYSDSRYMICTGNICKNLPIAERQNLVDMLFAEMQQGAIATVELDESIRGNLSDEQLYNMGATAANSEKFLKLWRGDWKNDYESQSEADFALLSMLGFYSLDNEQVRRVFRFCALGKRDKAIKNDKYLNYALAKIRAKLPPTVDLAKLIAANENNTNGTIDCGLSDAGSLGQDRIGLTLTALPTNPQPHGSNDSSSGQPAKDSGGTEGPGVAIDFPGGFVGELAEYIYSSAIKPVREVALAAALALTAGVVGRAFNISGTGLNQYLIVLGTTGCGKEGAATGIDALVEAARPICPMIDEFIGPAVFASGQGLTRVLDKTPCFVSILGEFGITLQEICKPTASMAQTQLKKVLLDIYAKSGHNKTLRPSVYSDSDKNTAAVRAPNVTIFGESNPEKFYEGLDANIISEGLLPRFSIFEYRGLRPPTNPNAFAPPPDKLVRQFTALAAVAMQAQQSRACCPVQRDAESLAMFRAFDKHADDKINGSNMDVTKQLWNRAHLKALKMAALIAVGTNPHQPIITKQITVWAIKLICRDIEKLVSKFEDGEVGTGDVRQELDVKRAVESYLKMKPAERKAYDCPEKMAHLEVVPWQYLRRRLRLLNSFKTDRRGATMALKVTVDALVEGDVLQKLNPMQVKELCGSGSPAFVCGPAWNKLK